MNSLLLLLLSIVVIVLGYLFYSKRMDRKVIQSDPNKATPARMYMDGVDFTPTSRNVLFGYQFKSIAALGPIVGAITALQWGWLPALLWLLLGVLFIGWVHDYTSAMIAVRSEGQTFGGLSYTLISPRARNILLVFIYFYILLILGAFGSIVANALLNTKMPLGIIVMTIAGILAGQMIYRWHVNIILTTVLTVAISFAGIWFGTVSGVGKFFEAVNNERSLIISSDLQSDLDSGVVSERLQQEFGNNNIQLSQSAIISIKQAGSKWQIIDKLKIDIVKKEGNMLSVHVQSPTLFGSVSQAVLIWTLLIFFFCYMGAVLPIWRWAQPINYVSFWIIGLGMLGAILGIAIWHPSLRDFPAFITTNVPGLGPIWPILFVTIACGAISGWHSLVSSSGTARQLERETDAISVTGGVMFAETLLAVIALIIAAVAFGGVEGYKVALRGENPELVSIVGKGPTAVFAGGLGELLSHIGIDKNFGMAFGGVFLIIMAITVMQLCLRFMRVASAEFLGNKLPIMRNVHIGSIVGVILSIFLVWTGYWQSLWVLFGGSNQLMAALALMLVSVWLIKSGKAHQWTSYPAIFMYITTIGALAYTSFTAFSKIVRGELTPDKIPGSAVAGAIAIFLIIAAIFLVWDALNAVIKLRRTR